MRCVGLLASKVRSLGKVRTSQERRVPITPVTELGVSVTDGSSDAQTLVEQPLSDISRWNHTPLRGHYSTSDRSDHGGKAQNE